MKRVLATLGLLALLCCSSACTAEAPSTVRLGALKGPTGMGLVGLMKRSDQGSARQSYEIALASQADELVAKLTNHDIDIALLPTATAANLAQKTGGGVEAIQINTLNTLYGISKANIENNIEALSGKTIYMSGKGTTPEYVIDALLRAAHIQDKVAIEFVSEPQEAVSKLMQAPDTSVAMLPEPFASSATQSIDGAKVVLDVGKTWKSIHNGDSEVVTALTVADTSFINNNQEAVSLFLEDAKDSVEAVLANPEQAAAEMVSYGIIASESVAQAAIPLSGITSICGQEMKDMLQPFYTTLASYDVAALGGSLPNEAFYYTQGSKAE